jgi:hypothetical protein
MVKLQTNNDVPNASGYHAAQLGPSARKSPPPTSMALPPKRDYACTGSSATFKCPRTFAALASIGALALGSATLHVDAMGQPSNPRSQPVSSKPEPSARQKKFDEQQLIALLPLSLGEWTLKKMWKPLPVGPLQLVPSLQAEYAKGTQTVELSFSSLMAVSKSDAARGIVLKRDEASGENIATVGLPNGLTLLASSRQADAEALTNLVHAIDLSHAGRLQAAAK